MNNLFIMHTQYNLILACGAIHSKYKNDNNELLLYAEFKISDSLKNMLEKVFCNIYYIREEFYNTTSILENEKSLHLYYKKSKNILKNKYDTIFMSQENYYDTLIVSKLSKYSKFKCIHIEEDAYFSLNDKYNHIDLLEYKKYLAKNKHFQSRAIDLFHKIYYGDNSYLKVVYCYGMSPIYSEAFVCYPSLVRKELQSKTLHEVTPNMLISGINALYSDITYELPESNSYVLFFFDLISRYKEPLLIEKIVDKLIEFCEKSGIIFLYKYHPRETDGFEKLKYNKQCYQLPTLIPSEKIIVDYVGKNVMIFGNATTAIQISAKFGFKTVSIARLNDFNNKKALEVFEKMGIYVPNNFEELSAMIKNIN